MRAFLASVGLTQRVFAGCVGLTEKHLSAIINGRVGVTAGVAARFEAATGIRAGVWAAMQIEGRVRELWAMTGAPERYLRITNQVAQAQAELAAR